ncbi:MAG: hypothetical protein AUK35_06385 [Zetaproteobacteria bacterium CG2_30_46_52]|nr:MAG: hypothetical protein AUK35_06385 [Zetaproteobacteria bacterium CG2_30_46_52]
MSDHDDSFFEFEELANDEYAFNSFEDEKLEDECDLLTVYCQTFIIERKRGQGLIRTKRGHYKKGSRLDSRIYEYKASLGLAITHSQ